MIPINPPVVPREPGARPSQWWPLLLVPYMRALAVIPLIPTAQDDQFHLSAPVASHIAPRNDVFLGLRGVDPPQDTLDQDVKQPAHISRNIQIQTQDYGA